MAETKKTTKSTSVVRKINGEIKKLKSKKFKFMFFVYDTKGAPNGSLSYIYNTAYLLKKMGYNVEMLYSEKDFAGVGSWMHKRYAELPHHNIETDGINVSPSDFLIIPEALPSVMNQTNRKLPCKRIVLLSNYRYMIDTIQPGVYWENYGIRDCITSTKKLEDKIKSVYPNMRTFTVRPMVSSVFKADGRPKKAIVNLICKDPSDASYIINEFYWKYPAYKWVAFQNIRNTPMSDMADALKDSFLTIWADSKTGFGEAALDAMYAGNVVVGKIPESSPDWMTDSENALRYNGLWCYDLDSMPELIAGVVQSFLSNQIPSEVYDNASKTVSEYLSQKMEEDIQKVYIDGFINERLKEFQIALDIAKKQNKKATTTEEKK